MLQAIRDSSKGIVAKIIVGLIILTFALFGIESIVALGGGNPAPAEVNGEEISELKVSQMVQLQKRRLQSQFGESFDPSIISDSMLKKSAVESLIGETLLKQAASNSGVYFSDQEIDKLIVQSPEFQVNGQFDRDQYDLVLRSAGFTRTTHRDLLRSNLSTQQAQSAWQATSFATAAEETRSAQLESQTRGFSYFEYSLEDAKKSAVVSNEEKQSYYDANTSQFMTMESVKIDYIELNRSDLLASIEIDDSELSERYDVIKAESAERREYRAAHILLLSNEAEARQTLKEIQAKLASGVDFAELAGEYSQDDTSKFAGGDLGFSAVDVYEDEFSQALSELSKGDVSGIVETRDGLHLIKLVDTRQPEVASFADLKDSLVQDMKTERSQALYIEKLDALNDEAFSAPDLQGPAQALSLTVKTSAEFTRQGGAGIASNPKVSAAAFTEGVMFDDINSEVIELNEGQAVVLHLNNLKESAVKPFEKVAAEIETRLRNEKALESLKAQLDTAIASAKKGELNVDWSAHIAKSRNAKGVESAVLTKAFTMALTANGEASFDLVDLSAGNKAIIRLDAINRVAGADSTDSDEQKVARGKSFNEYKAYHQYFSDIADIERN
jgi:peptidyl-prolyl cis-trans isomerase D